jgi:ArsR family transcriptional regulator, arsenate/arsenite/antimonite-responsive transcriptional repressor
MTSPPIPELVRMHKAMGHPVRLRLLGMLRGGPLCVCQMTVVVRLAGSTVSEHLGELKRAGLVAEKKEGRWVRYRLAESDLARRLLAAVWEELDRDAHAKADAVLLRDLRRVSVEELCGAGLDLNRLGSRSLIAAAKRADALRAAAQDG